MENKQLCRDIYYVGVDDHEIDLFEGQYKVPNGISYNSYIILDDKVAIMDTVDVHKVEKWLSNLTAVLDDKIPDYLVVTHMEPDHAGSIGLFLEHYPKTKIIANQKAYQMMQDFFPNLEWRNRVCLVSDGDTLSLGEHTLKFIFAPMVHWPEVMVAYEELEGILFSADGFGKFGALDTEEEWDCEARRYYINIVGKYGASVQNLLKKAATLNIKKIFPLHGPMLTENLAYYINKYDIWSSYKPEDRGVFIAYTSIYGNTERAVVKLQAMLLDRGIEKVVIADLARSDMAECVEDAFRYDRLVLASPTYDGGLFPFMNEFIHHLKSKNFQNRTVGFVENGSWAPQAGALMMKEMSALKNITIIEPKVTIRSAVKESDNKALKALADQLAR